MKTSIARLPAHATVHRGGAASRATRGLVATVLWLLAIACVPAWAFPEPYCDVGITYDVEPITRVQFAGIDNASSGTINGTPVLQDFLTVTGHVEGGTTYPFTGWGNTAGNWTNYFRVFIDWNRNGDFSDPGESYDIGTITNTANGAVSSTIAVPANATTGTTRMRVVKKYNAYAGPCETLGFGQAEDYTLDVHGRDPQAITNFAATPAAPEYATDATFAVSADGGGSGIPVTFSLAPSSAGICTIGGSTVTVAAAGVCTVLADQVGNSEYQPAPQASLAVTIAPATTALSIDAPTAIAWGQGIDVGADVSVASTGAAVATGIVTVDDGTHSCSFDLATATSCSLAPPALPGPLTLAIGYVGGGNYAPGSATAGVDVVAHGVGGVIVGLAGSELLLHLGDGGAGADMSPAAGATAFAFPTPVAFGATYTVTIARQPSNPVQTCTLGNGSGTMPATDVAGVVIACTTNTYAVGGSVSGLTTSGLQLGLNGGAPAAIAADGAFAFPTPLPSGSSYVARSSRNRPTRPARSPMAAAA